MMESTLVSVVVVAYNSSQYIVELLDSIGEQTYKNLELIISDDCSTDNTLELCRNWVLKNRNRFFNCEIITKEKNEGITYNYNSGWNIAKGTYIKFIEGDDLLTKNCIKDNVDFVIKKNVNIVFSKAIYFGKDIAEIVVPQISKKQMDKYTKTSNSIYNRLLKSNILVNPTIFISKNLLERNHGFDNKYKMLVDYPFFLKISGNGEIIGYMDKVTVKYRKHGQNLSISDGKSDRYISELFYSDLYKFYNEENKYRIKKSKNILTILETKLEYNVRNKIVNSGNTLQQAKKYNWLLYLGFWTYLRKIRERLTF